MDITFLQTADPLNYNEMMLATSQTVIRFCKTNACRYESYTGIKKGYFSWHSTFNRCYMLKELMDRGYKGWAVYLDADAYIADLSFDLHSFLASKHNFAAIMAISDDNERSWWDVNAGVVMLNFAEPLARLIVERWHALTEAIPDSRMRAARNFSQDGFDDQIFLQSILRDEPSLEESIYNPPISLINSPTATFIRQFFRAADSNLERRTANIAREVRQILQHHDPAAGNYRQNDDAETALTHALYNAILHRPADTSGLQSFVPYLQQLGLVDGAGFLARELVNSREFASTYGR
ncbi:hypothetical protein [Sphingomonas sp. TZW2008]|uniref:hypothetical protein n=1 Tax=Sphingomonas sp. TZW2008 TaxID=1917973 RepID=UPI001181A8BF|nr:hypothetical protein [Sphingomonas sp. TZW2008]